MTKLRSIYPSKSPISSKLLSAWSNARCEGTVTKVRRKSCAYTGSVVYLGLVHIEEHVQIRHHLAEPLFHNAHLPSKFQRSVMVESHWDVLVGRT